MRLRRPTGGSRLRPRWSCGSPGADRHRGSDSLVPSRVLETDKAARAELQLQEQVEHDRGSGIKGDSLFCSRRCQGKDGHRYGKTLSHYC